MSARNVASIVAIMGATGSGKSTYIKQALAARTPARLIIWDPIGEYAEFGQVHSLAAEAWDLVAAAAARKPFALVFQPGLDPRVMAPKFDWLCRLALAARNLTLIVEELKFVTRPSFAPIPWAQLCLQGRHQGVKLIGTSQRPAHIDKDFLGNATLIRTGRLNYDEDVKAVSKAMRADPDAIATLKPLEFIEVNRTTGEQRAGRIEFARPANGARARAPIS